MNKEEIVLENEDQKNENETTDNNINPTIVVLGISGIIVALGICIIIVFISKNKSKTVDNIEE